MKILIIGDVVAGLGLERVKRTLPALKRRYQADLCIINGENSCGGRGIDRKSFEILESYGGDIITMGNHTWDNYQIYDLFDEGKNIIRPANFPKGTAGEGYIEYDMGKNSVCVINLQGRVGMEALDCPFQTVDSILEEVKSKIIIVDFHAEATSEKQAMGLYLDGKISLLFGTHTHVATADERILPCGSGYITDIGMTGVINSVIGMDVNTSLTRLRNKLPSKYTAAMGKTMLNGIFAEFDDSTALCTHIERVYIDD